MYRRAINATIKLIDAPFWTWLTRWLVYDFGILRSVAIAYLGIGLAYLSNTTPTYVSPYGVDNVYYAAIYIYIGGGMMAKGRFMFPLSALKSIVSCIPLFMHLTFRMVVWWEDAMAYDVLGILLSFMVVMVQLFIIMSRSDMPDPTGRIDVYLNQLFADVRNNKADDIIARTD